MGILVKMIGLRFHRLLVVERLPGGRRLRYRCLCDCGRLTEAYGENLRNGHVKSCGCFRVEHTAAKNTTHGLSDAATYETWKGMRSRCANKRNKNYPSYGGRGITVCERWNDYSNFVADMGERPPGRSIDRIDNDGPYSPENCRWATKIEQANNVRRTKFLTLYGETKPLAEWARLYGLKYHTLYQRVRDKRSQDRMLLPV